MANNPEYGTLAWAEEELNKQRATFKKDGTPVNRYKILRSINVSEKVEKKNGLSYLSWAWAWDVLRYLFPESYSTIYENENGLIYFTDGKTGWVKTGITLVDGDYKQELIECLPIMSPSNKAIPVESIDMFTVNKTIQRSLTKAIARHGLGMYIYAGEDLPEESEDEKAKKAEAQHKIDEERADTIKHIDEQAKRIVAGKDAAWKKQFVAEQIVPVLGMQNYKQCTDNEKLKELLTKLIDYKE